MDLIQVPERAYYEELYGRVMKERKVLRQTFECHSPELFRIYDQILYPLKDGKGIVVINSLKKERKWDEEVRSFAENVELAYLMQDAFYHQCSNCRKTLRNDGSGEWDLIPGHLENPPSNISHTICPVCFEHYWKGGAA